MNIQGKLGLFTYISNFDILFKGGASPMKGKRLVIIMIAFLVGIIVGLWIISKITENMFGTLI